MSLFASILRRVLSIALVAFFRRRVTTGEIPDGPVIYVLNHPNGLIDPLFILTSAPKGVSFMAKEPLFRMPIVGRMVKALGCLPIYRAEDGANTKDNARTLEAAGTHLQNGGAIALFPEGTSHSDAELKPLRTGAARIALSANANGHHAHLVPAGLYYSKKYAFRSDVAIHFGKPIAVPNLSILPNQPIPRDEVKSLTAQIDDALRELTVNALTDEDIRFASDAKHVLEPSLELDKVVDRKQALIRARQKMPPQQKQELTRDIEKLAIAMRKLGIDGSSSQRSTVPLLGFALFFAVLLGPLGLLSIAVHAPAYYAIRAISKSKWSPFREQDQLSSMKVFAGLFLYPFTWVALGIAVGYLSTPWIGLIVGVLGPFWGYVGLRYQEILEGLSADATLTYALVSRPRRIARVQAARNRLSKIIEPLVLRESSTLPVPPTQ